MFVGSVSLSANTFCHAWITGYSGALWGSAVSCDGNAPGQGKPGAVFVGKLESRRIERSIVFLF
jgi:hypothetical protein